MTAGGVSRSDPAYKLPPTLAPLLKGGFEASPDDDPTVETLPGESNYALLAVGRVIEAAPAPFATVRAQVSDDWIARQAANRARAVATAIAAKAARNVPLTQAVAEAGVALPKVDQIALRRIDMAQMGDAGSVSGADVVQPRAGKSRMVAAPNGQAFYIVRVVKIVPGNALTQPGLIGRMQGEFGRVAGEEYVMQFVGAIQSDLKIKRNEKAIADAKRTARRRRELSAPLILAIDNYDSFTFTLVDYLLSLGADVRVERNDAISVDEALASGAARISDFARARQTRGCRNLRRAFARMH